MADNNVFITGVADGAFDALPEWATQDTAEHIEKILTESLKIQTKALTQMVKTATAGGTGLSQKELEDAGEEIQKLTKHFKRTGEEFEKEKKRNKDKDRRAQEEGKSWATTKTALNLFRTAIASTGNAVKQAFVDNISTFDTLYQSGINVVDGFSKASSGFEALQQLTVLTGVRFTELSKTIVKYNTAVNSFGLAKFAKTFSGATKELSQFGYNSKEAAELLGAYLESQRGFNDVNAQTQGEAQKNLVKFGERITRLSQATGVLRSKLLEDIEAISQSVEANILAGQVGNDAAGSTLEFISSFKDKNLGQAFLRMMTDAIKPLNETFMDFQKTGFGGFGQKLMSFTQSLEGLDPEEAARRTAEFAKANDAELKMMVQRGNLLRQAGVKEADGMLKIATGLQQQGRTYKYISEEDRKKTSESAKAAKDLQTNWERLMSQLQAAFVPAIPLLVKLAEALAWVNTKIEQFSGLFSNTERAWLGAAAILLGIVGSLKITSLLLNRMVSRLSSAGGYGGSGATAGAGKGKWLGRVGRGVAGGVGGIVAGLGLDYATEKLQETGHDTAAAATDIASSAASMAGIGAALGSVIPGLGTVVGGLVGGAAGGIYGTYKNWNKFSSPKQTTIESPSAVPAEESTRDSPSATSTNAATETAKDKSDKGADINNTLTYQNALLTQILESSQALVAVNRDILKYSRVHS